jgi:cytidylate kinase
MAVLTISREFRSGAHEVGSAVAELLSYKYVGKEQLAKDLQKAGERWRQLFYDLDETVPSMWEKYDWEYAGFISQLESIILDYALNDRVIIVGRGANFLLQDIPHVLKICLTAPLEKRIERVMLKEYVDRKTAEWLTEKTDRARAGYIQVNYHKNWYNLKYYDAVFNTDVQPYEQIAKILADALIERDSQATPEARDLLQGRALAARIKAKIATDPRFTVPTLEVTYDGNAIVLRGVVHNLKEFHRIDEITKKTAGDKSVRNELHLRT